MQILNWATLPEHVTISRTTFIDAVEKELMHFYSGWRGPGSTLPVEVARYLGFAIYARVIEAAQKNGASK